MIYTSIERFKERYPSIHRLINEPSLIVKERLRRESSGDLDSEIRRAFSDADFTALGILFEKGEEIRTFQNAAFMSFKDVQSRSDKTNEVLDELFIHYASRDPNPLILDNMRRLSIPSGVNVVSSAFSECMRFFNGDPEYREIGDELLASLADVNGNGDVLARACAENNIEAMRYLISRGADVDAGNAAAMRWSISRSHAQAVDILIASGADKDHALLYACENRLPGMVEHLIARGANVNARDSQFKTPLDHTMSWVVASSSDMGSRDKAIQCARILIEADANTRTISGLLAKRYLAGESFSASLKDARETLSQALSKTSDVGREILGVGLKYAKRQAEDESADISPFRKKYGYQI